MEAEYVALTYAAGELLWILELSKNVKNDLRTYSIKLEFFEKIGFAFRLTLKEEHYARNKKGYITIDIQSSGVGFQTANLKENNERYCNLRKDYEEKQKKIVDQMVDVSGCEYVEGA
ncbi:DNA mismatch repair protein Msh2 [Nephila pilipes]|uniref:DNA mismatch repair protein Msh2 n=1 Tax=Nephila pilipes TaxID=299642 RepID=A0A8X6Q101_NEPPI|nr:DNA mismatch repair protein Msh2 [Nephila pilipes]